MPITPNDPADFGPTLGNYTELKPFRYWCQKVLPLVYDDSLSYYELLCKVINYLNITMQDVETLHGDVGALNNAYNQLQDYVNNYFSSLDVQQEINNKLDEMANNGTLTDLLNNHFLPSGNCNISIAQKLYQVGMTYFNENYTNLIYAHLQEGGNAMDYKNGPTYGYSEDSPNHQGYYINCACLTNLMLLGVPYQYSMYNTQNGLHNKIGIGGYKSMLIPDINSETYTQVNYTTAMANRFREQGLGFWCNNPYNQIQVGDVIFYFNEDSGSGDRLNDIRHCNIVIGVVPNDVTQDPTGTLFITMDATNGDHPISILHWELNDLQTFTSDNLIYIGRPIYSEIGGKAAHKILGVYQPLSSTINITDLNIIGGKMLTLDFDYTPSNNNEHINLSCNDGYINYMIKNATTANTNMIGKTIHLSIPISLNLLGNNTPLNKLTLTIANGAYNDVRNLIIYDGLSDGERVEWYTAETLNDILNIALRTRMTKIYVNIPQIISDTWIINSGYYTLITNDSGNYTTIKLNNYTHDYCIYYNGSEIELITGISSNPINLTINNVYNMPDVTGNIYCTITFEESSYSTGTLVLLGSKAIFISTIGLYIIDKTNTKYKNIGTF